jgi:hypothetical protein
MVIDFHPVHPTAITLHLRRQKQTTPSVFLFFAAYIDGANKWDSTKFVKYVTQKVKGVH